MYRAVKELAEKKRMKACERGGESDTLTPSCQFACGPLSQHYPALSLLHHLPLGSRVWFSDCEIQSDVTRDESQRGDEKQRLGKTWGWKFGGCWRDFIGQEMDSFAKLLCHTSKFQ